MDTKERLMEELRQELRENYKSSIELYEITIKRLKKNLKSLEDL